MPHFHPTLAILSTALSLFGAGCAAVPVSRTKTFEFERLVRSIPEETASRTVSADKVRPVVSVDGAGGKIFVGLAGSGSFRRRIRDSYETFSVETQKRMAFGFFPAFAEDIYRPDRSLRPAGVAQACNAAEVFFGWPFATLYSLLAVPFSDDYAHSSHAWEDEGAYNGHMALLAGLSQAERTRLGMPPRSSGGVMLHDPAHLSMLGFFKYTTFVVHPPAPSRTVSRNEDSPFEIEAHGPYEVEISIPELGYRMRNEVVAGDVRTEFPVPSVDESRTVEARVRFLDPAGTFGPFAGDLVSEEQKELFSRAKGRSFPIKVAIPPKSALARPGETVVVEVSGRPKARSVPFRLVSKTHDGKSRIVYRVRIEDDSRSAFEIDRIVRPDIVEDLRETFQSKHPDLSPDRIHAWADYTVEDGLLVYAGAAFSILPTGVDGYSWDENARRGRIRIRLGEGTDADAARGWARDCISRIVRDKGIAITVGSEVPENATFQTLDEQIENGFLVVDFEAVD